MDHAAHRQRPTLASAGALAVVLLCGVDLVVVRGPLGAEFVLDMLLLSLPLGAVGGLVLQLLTTRVASVRWVGPWLLPLSTLASAAWLASNLGAFERVGGTLGKTAWAVIAACLVGGISLAACLWALSSSRRHPQGPIRTRSRAVQLAAGIVLVAAAGALTYVDHVYYVNLYLGAHLALRLCAAIAATLGLGLLLRPPRLGLRAWAALLVMFSIPVATLHASDVHAVQAFITRPWPGLVLGAARGLFDFDRDGFAPVLGGGDCDNWNARIHPEAREVPGNGIDDNCMFGDASRRPPTPDTVPKASAPSPTSVVLITMDTLRWDRFGPNDPRHADTMPKLAHWSKGATNFRRAYTPGGWTSIAIASTFFGRYGRRLQWKAHYENKFFRLLRKKDLERNPKQKIVKMFPLAWHDPNRPLPYWLKRRGMHTAAVVDDGFSQMLARHVGTNIGFATYREITPGNRSSANVTDATTTDAALVALHQAQGRAPFFLWVHYFGPHTPNTDHPNIKKDGDSQEQRYDHEVRFLDQQVVRLLGEVEKLGEKVAIFVTSDHGEDFGKGYRSHGMDLREALIRVPMLAKVEGWKSGTVEEPVSLIDIAPTILSLTHTPPPPGLDGIDLDPIVRGRAPMPQRLLYTDTWLYRPGGATFSDMVAVYDGSRKVVFNRKAHSFSAEDQEHPAQGARRLEGITTDRLVRAALAYVEETGGRLAVTD